MGWSVVLAFFAAASNAVSSVLQRASARTMPESDAFRLKLFVDLLHRPLWLVGISALAVGAALQAVALYFGALVLVEPLLLMELPLTLLIAAYVFDTELPRRLWYAVGAMVVGLAAVMVALDPSGGSAFPSPARWFMAGIAGLALVFVLVLGALRATGEVRAFLLATSSAVCFGFTAALMKDAVDHLSLGASHFFESWQLYATAIVGTSSLFLLQNAFQSGSLVAAQPPLTLGDATVSVLLGITVFDEQVRTGPWLVVEILGGLCIVAGVVELARSPLLREVQQGG